MKCDMVRDFIDFNYHKDLVSDFTANIYLRFIKNLNEEKFDIFGHKNVTYHRGQAATFAP